jgi:hypothetical protein
MRASPVRAASPLPPLVQLEILLPAPPTLAKGGIHCTGEGRPRTASRGH